jgi:hypothetical protein
VASSTCDKGAVCKDPSIGLRESSSLRGSTGGDEEETSAVVVVVEAVTLGELVDEIGGISSFYTLPTRILCICYFGVYVWIMDHEEKVQSPLIFIAVKWPFGRLHQIP